MVSRLEDLCGFQVAILHASEQDVKEKIIRLWDSDVENHIDFDDGYGEWYPKMERKAWETLKKFNVLRNKIPISVVIFCVIQSAKWAKFHKKKFGLPFRYGYYFLRSSFFTSQGLVNREAAARVMVNDVQLRSSFRFCIACFYSLTDAITPLFRQLPENERLELVNGKYKNYLGITAENKMVSLWSHYLFGFGYNNYYEHNSFPLHKFKTAVLTGSEVAAQKHWKELNYRERIEMIRFCSKTFFEELVSYAKSQENLSEDILSYFEPFVDLIKFILQNSDKNERDLLVSSSYKSLVLRMLYYFLHWPYQNMFVRTIDEFGELLTVRNFNTLFKRIVCFMNHQFSYALYDYYVLFRNIWDSTTPSFKRYFFSSEANDINDIPVIAELFHLPCRAKNDIIRLVFESATSEEKLNIVRIYGKIICGSAIEVGDLKICDLFIECCVDQKRVSGFKRNLVYDYKICKKLKTLILSNQLDQVREILTWALDERKIKKFMPKLFSSFLPQEIRVLIKDLETLDKNLHWILTPEESRVIKKKIFSNVGCIVDCCFKKFYGDFTCFDFYLKNIFTSDKEIDEYKERLAFSGICNRDFQKDYFELSEGLDKVEKFFKWTKFSQEKRREFKECYVFKKPVIHGFSNVLIQQNLHCIDDFLEWTELPKVRVNEFKSTLVLSNQTWISTVCLDQLMNNKRDCLTRIIKWADLTEKNTQKFYMIMFGKLHLTESRDKVKFDEVKYILRELPLSKEKIKRIKRKIGYKSFGIFAVYVMEEMWDEAEELLNWCFSSEEEVSSFGIRNATKIQKQCLNMIESRRFEDVDLFLEWKGFCSSVSVGIWDRILYDCRTFRMIARTLVDGEGEDKKFLNFFFKTDTKILKCWKKDFVKWYNFDNLRRNCLYCYTSLKLKKSFYCSSCKCFNPSPEHIKSFNKTINSHLNNIKKSKRQLEEASEERECKLIKIS